jgi:hypothetical protein
MSGTCSTYGRTEIGTKFWLVNAKEIGHLRDRELKGRITVTRILYADVILSGKCRQ